MIFVYIENTTHLPVNTVEITKVGRMLMTANAGKPLRNLDDECFQDGKLCDITNIIRCLCHCAVLYSTVSYVCI
jgi:hypothetical protein